jgi:hypothetical protein
MRSIIIHARRFTISSECASTRPKGIVSKRHSDKPLRLLNPVLAFVTIEKHDSEHNARDMAAEIEAVRKQVSGSSSMRDIALIPFAHLSSKLMAPRPATELIGVLFHELSNLAACKVILGDFGFSSQWKIVAHSHPLSCVYRET